MVGQRHAADARQQLSGNTMLPPSTCPEELCAGLARILSAFPQFLDFPFHSGDLGSTFVVDIGGQFGEA